jgi:hypothetical protein
MSALTILYIGTVCRNTDMEYRYTHIYGIGIAAASSSA